MRENKIKEAFRKVKEDMMLINKQIDEIKKKEKARGERGPTLEKKKFDNFVNNVENELNSLNLYVREFDDKLKHLSTQVQKNTESSKKYQNAQSEGVDMDAIDARFEELSEILNEKITLETSSIKLEFTEEIANVYDKVFNEILDLKKDINKIGETKKEDTKTPKKTPKKQSASKEEKEEAEREVKAKKETRKEEEPEELYPQSKDGKIKKIARWLFVDEEEEDIGDIKSQIKSDTKESEKKKRKKDKDDLY